ncbi:hypothetical protein HKX48_003980 [Thoreauomyces humboldtii]|nr:hypothetical protein HKX48_003980 [Thoreauomyces humboldtii]
MRTHVPTATLVLLALASATASYAALTSPSLENAVALGKPFTIPLSSPGMQQINQQNAEVAAGRTSGAIDRRSSVIEDHIYYNTNVSLSFFGQVSFGTPAQTFTLLFDTGSFQLWVRSSRCTSSLCSRLPEFRGSQSSTYVGGSLPGNAAPDVQYADGTEVTGVYSTDTVTVDNLPVTGLTFMEIITTTDTTGSAFDGIMGMCWPQQGYPNTYLQTLIANGAMKSPVMGYWVQEDAEAGEVTMGGVDLVRFTGNFTWIPSFGYSSDGTGKAPFVFYQGLALGASYVVGGTHYDVPWTTSDNYLSVFDTGTSFAYLPRRVAASLHANMAGFSVTTKSDTDYYTAYCSAASIAALGEINLSFVGQDGAIVTLSVQPLDYLLLVSTGAHGICQSIFVGSDGVQEATSANGPIVASILGNAFLKTFYTVFDWGNNRTGFATSVRTSGGTSNLQALNDTTTGTGTFTGYLPVTSGGDSNTNLGSVKSYVLMALPTLATLLPGLLTNWLL